MIQVRTWCRADLAGGTLDIWPLGLLHPGARTINVALDLPVEVRLRPRASGYEVNQGGERLASDSLEALASFPGASLVAAVGVSEAMTPFSLEISTGSPRGAGLGASSALAVALLAAAEAQRSGSLTRSAAERAAVARDLEARLMGLPTGLQDHFPAQLGGVLEIEHAPGGERLATLPVDLERLGAHLIVAFTGQSHFSAGANWLVVRRRLEGDPPIVARLEAIAGAARALPAALKNGAWAEVGELVGAEWAARRELSDEISTPAIERLLKAAAELGAWGGKACGAGGGGSILVMAPPESRKAIVEAWTAQGAEVLPVRPTAKGLELEIET